MRDLWARARWVIAAALVTVVGVFGLSQLSGAPRGGPLEVAPADATVVVAIDANQLLRSTLWRALLDDRGDGPRRVERTCGYDPLAGVERVVVYLFGDEEHPFEHVGFVAHGEVARGDAHRQRLVGCVGRVLAEQGGATTRIEIEGVPAMASARGRSAAAFLGDDAVVGGDRDVVARAIRVTDHREASAAEHAELRSLWESVAARPHVVAVARLPERWLPALRRMAGGLPDELGAFADVRALALGARLERGIDLRLVLRATPSQAPGLGAAVRGQIAATLAEPRARLSVLGSALRRVQVQQNGQDVVLDARLSDELLEDLVLLGRELPSVGDLDLDDVPDGGSGGGDVAPRPVVAPHLIADPEVGDDAGGEEHEQQE